MVAQMTQEPAYVPLERTSATGAPRGPLAVCTRCGAVVEGDVTGQNRHDIWHRQLDDRISDARRWRPAPRIGGR